MTNSRCVSSIILVAFFLAGCLLLPVSAQVADRDIFVPTTISAEAQEVLNNLSAGRGYTRPVPAPDNLEAWRIVHETLESGPLAQSKNIAAANNVTVTEATIGGVPVLDIRPAIWLSDGPNGSKVLVYTHGGAYTLFSAGSTLGSSAQMSRATGLRVISVDYTTAPFANWSEIQEQVISVFEALLAQGYTMNDIAIYGDSAGGGLATSTVLNLRDQEMGMPAVVVLWSPWVDLTDRGDTLQTLKEDDPQLTYSTVLGPSALAYADGLDLGDRRVSPLYSDFSKGFPPTLIQGGTKEILLSTAVRLYRTLDTAGQEVTLDIYEGMPHVFQQQPIPEAQLAINKSAAFILKHLE